MVAQKDQDGRINAMMGVNPRFSSWPKGHLHPRSVFKREFPPSTHSNSSRGLHGKLRDTQLNRDVLPHERGFDVL